MNRNLIREERYKLDCVKLSSADIAEWRPKNVVAVGEINWIEFAIKLRHSVLRVENNYEKSNCDSRQHLSAEILLHQGAGIAKFIVNFRDLSYNLVCISLGRFRVKAAYATGPYNLAPDASVEFILLAHVFQDLEHKDGNEGQLTSLYVRYTSRKLMNGSFKDVYRITVSIKSCLWKYDDEDALKSDVYELITYHYASTLTSLETNAHLVKQQKSMLHLFHQAYKQHHDDRDKNVRHEEDYPASVVRIEAGISEKHIAANKIRVEEEKFHEQHEKYEL